ncbi:putative SagB-type dehydrogenase domain protein [Megalodesulfovibrio gigas DSM 1382 = ATCC 19364]|uniref:Putative SagB-type dehydrogenase domain protein n=2 Tax=Megalodesulfovibrio gigas TaxID=879 RepID=T2G863_MEGG1|nr:putative SagB-type dehydrogenase domain protein [Megalodesulfovibrio gigas DSM 1382 = ATCC 19364]
MEYHHATSHVRERLAGRELDWAHRPEVFKRYPPGAVEQLLPLPACAVAAAQSLPLLLQGRHARTGRPSLQQLSNILGLASGITRTRIQGGGAYHFRTWASAGGLFPCELYLALGGAWEHADPEGRLVPGLWHHQPETHSLTLLRHGDALGVAAMAAGLPEASSRPSRLAGVACITAIVHRSAWKYGERAYRYLLLDAGHLAENLLLALWLEGYGAMWAADFKDDAMNALLGLDGEREICLLAIPFFSGEMPDAFAAMPAPAGPLAEFADRNAVQDASRCARVERPWPVLLGLHRAGNIESRFVGRSEAASPPAVETLFGADVREPLPLQDAAAVHAERLWPSISRTILSRRSQRRFVSEPVPAATFQAFCHLLCDRSLQDRGARNLCLALGLRNIDGFSDGLYALDREGRTLTLLHPDAPHEALALACLGQTWMVRAAVQVCMVADVAACEGRWGPRSYRALGLAAGRLGQRVYLAATSLGWGACGVGAFFDDEAGAVLGLRGAARLLYAVPAGPVAEAT